MKLSSYIYSAGGEDGGNLTKKKVQIDGLDLIQINIITIFPHRPDLRFSSWAPRVSAATTTSVQIPTYSRIKFTTTLSFRLAETHNKTEHTL